MAKSLENPMLPDFSHDDAAEQAFVVDLKKYIGNEIEPHCRALSQNVEANLGPSDSDKPDSPQHVKVRRALEPQAPYQSYIHLVRMAQDMMWESVGHPIDRQLDDLAEQADIKDPKGSLTVDPNFTAPAYVSTEDVHRMPGGYDGTLGDRDVRQGVMYDSGGYVYFLGGKNGGHLNDGRGHTLAAHALGRLNGKTPDRILEMGCSAGNSTVAMAKYFPDSEFHAIDVGDSMLRYAHARAEHLGAAVHFSQQDAAHTTFEDESFDMILSCVMFHETSHKAAPEIIEECFRLLKPGGLVAHLEVPIRHGDLDTWSLIRGDYEAQFNHEPYWHGVLQLDFVQALKDAGFEAVQDGFQDATRDAINQPGEFREENRGVFRSWYVASGIKPGA